MQTAPIARKQPRRIASGLGQNFPKRAGKRTQLQIGKDHLRAASVPFAGFSPVRVNLKSKSLFEVLKGQGSHPLFGSESLQMEAIMFFYEILSAHSAFEDSHDFSLSTSTSEVLLHLIHQFNKIAGERWNLKKENGSFSIKGVRVYEQEFNYFYGMPLCFLPQMKEQSPVLHDLIVGLVGLLCKKKQISLWQEDESYTIDYFWQELKYNRQELDKDYVKEIRKEVRLFKTGEAAQYLKLIKKSKATTKEIEVALQGYTARNEQERLLCEWIKKGIELLALPYTLDDFVNADYFTESDDDCPVLPYRYMRFVWMSTGAVMDNVMECMNSDCGEWGDIPLNWKVNISKKGDLEETLPLFPLQFLAFMDRGVEIGFTLIGK